MNRERILRGEDMVALGAVFYREHPGATAREAYRHFESVGRPGVTFNSWAGHYSPKAKAKMRSQLSLAEADAHAALGVVDLAEERAARDQRYDAQKRQRTRGYASPEESKPPTPEQVPVPTPAPKKQAPTVSAESNSVPACKQGSQTVGTLPETVGDLIIGDVELSMQTTKGQLTVREEAGELRIIFSCRVPRGVSADALIDELIATAR